MSHFYTVNLPVVAEVDDDGSVILRIHPSGLSEAIRAADNFTEGVSEQEQFDDSVAAVVAVVQDRVTCKLSDAIDRLDSPALDRHPDRRCGMSDRGACNDTDVTTGRTCARGAGHPGGHVSVPNGEEW